MSGSSSAASENATFDIISRLPYDLALMVARKLKTRDLHECSLVCRSWNRVFMDESVVMPLIQQMSHFDQEPIMYQTLPTGHEKEPEEHLEADGEDTQTEKEEKARSVENYANQQWLKNRRVLLRVLQKLLNRDRRWRRGQPTTRIYLPPVPLDGTDGDIRAEWQGSVRVVKMKGGIVAALYTEGKVLRMWRLDTEYDEVKALTDAYITKNRELLEAQTKYGGPPLPPVTEENIERLLKISQSGQPRKAVPMVVRLRKPARLFDFFILSSTLATASQDNDVDIYDYRTGLHKHTFHVRGTETIGSLHIWLDYVVVGHGTRITLWNHKTGAVLEDSLATAHNAPITGVFVLDNDMHLLSIDAAGFMVITDRSASSPKDDTLLDVPLYPMILAGQMGAPYMMRLLHASHLCVWGKYSLGHFELYEPGLGNLPPLSNLLVTPREGEEPMHEGEEEGEGASGGQTASAASPISSAAKPAPEDEPLQVLAQLEATHNDLELMYRTIAGDRGDMFPDGQRIERHRRNKTTAEQRYHIINIDSPFEEPPEGDVICVDFRRALYLYGTAIEIFDVDKRQNGRPVGVPLGLFPVDSDPRIKLPPAPPKQRSKAEEAGESGEAGERSGADNDDDAWSTEESDAAFPETVEDLEEALAGWDAHYGRHGEFAQYVQLLRGLEGMPVRGEEHRHDQEQPDQQGHEEGQEGAAQLELLSTSDINDGSELGLIEAVVMRCIITLRMSMDLPPGAASGAQEIKLVEQSRQFLGRYFPEIFAACYARVDPQVLLSAAPFYIQRLHESRFDQPTINVDHRGQKTTAEQLVRDMKRVYRAAGVRNAGQWTSQEGFVPLAATQLLFTSAAMDDGRVAVGCTNGYIVVTTYD